MISSASRKNDTPLGFGTKFAAAVYGAFWLKPLPPEAIKQSILDSKEIRKEARDIRERAEAEDEKQEKTLQKIAALRGQH